jgi:NAD(P)-dependent dehydrogenase (short-subunit alcohol dehydrogenase family)
MSARCILVTGAGSGIGAGIAAELAASGHHLVVTDVNLDAAESSRPRSATTVARPKPGVSTSPPTTASPPH